MTALLLVVGATAFAQATPAGVWHGIDDKSGEPKAPDAEGWEGGKLEVRGSIGPFWRTQTWVRVQ